MKLTIKTKLFIAAVLVMAAALALVIWGYARVHAASIQVPGITTHTINPPAGTQDFYTFFNATTTTATSTTAASAQDPGFARVGGASDVVFYFSRGDTKGTGNSGSSVFKVQVTPDGTNWFDYNELGVVGTSTTGDQYYTRVSSVTIPAGTSTQMWAMDDISFYGVRCIATRITDGESTCKATITYPGTF